MKRMLLALALVGCGDGGLSMRTATDADAMSTCGPTVAICRDGSCAGSCMLHLPYSSDNGVSVFVDGKYEGWPFYLEGAPNGDSFVLTGGSCTTWLKGATWPLDVVYGPYVCTPVHQ